LDLCCDRPQQRFDARVGHLLDHRQEPCFQIGSQVLVVWCIDALTIDRA